MSEKGSRHRPWFPFFAGDFMNTTRRWTCEEIGAYILLLGEQWINEDVPTDIDELARIHPDIAKHWKTKLQRKFPDGRNPRMEELREEMMQRSAKNRDSALRRWGHVPSNSEDAIDDANGDALAHANADANGNANAHAKGDAPRVRKDMLSTPTSISKDTTKSKSQKTSSVSDSMWTKFCDLYPKRNGPDPNKSARAKAERALKNGAAWSDIMTGLRRYKDHCDRSITDANFIMRKETFLNPVKEFWNSEYADTDEQSGVGVDDGPTPEQQLLDMADILGLTRNNGESDRSFRDRLGKANAHRIEALGSRH